MTVNIKKSTASGSVAAPPSKSAAHRALICGALSCGSTVTNIEYSNDISATLDCLEALGAKVTRGADSVIIGGLNPQCTQDAILDCRESGSTLRFLIPLCMMCDRKITLVGSERLFSRNLEVFEKIAADSGILFEKHTNRLTLKGKLLSGDYKVAGNISSQFISGLLFALPLLQGDSTLEIVGEYESAPYVALTVKALRDFGINIEKSDERIYKIKGGQHYAATNTAVEGDYSNAAFLDGFNLLGGNVAVTGLCDNTLQGDSVYKEMFSALNSKSGNKHFDLSNCPDLAPVMFALSAVCGGAEFVGTKRLKIKESDRAEAMREELAKFGISVDVYENSVTVHGGELGAPTETLYGHNDHRIVMALSLLCSVTGGTIKGASAVAKSYPDYFEKIKTLGIVIDYEV